MCLTHLDLCTTGERERLSEKVGDGDRSICSHILKENQRNFLKLEKRFPSTNIATLR